MPSTLPVHRVLGLPVHIGSDYMTWLAARVQAGQGTHVVTLNAEMAMLARREPELAQLIQRAELVVPDGAGVVWALGLGGAKIDRCPGIELVEKLLPLLQANQPIYLLGAKPGIAAQVAAGWQARFSQLALAGLRDGYFTPDQEPEVLAELRRLQPAVVLVGLGVPRQEYLIQQWRIQLPQVVWIGVGGSFDVWSGQKIRAPQWFRDNSLEWLYRLYQEPHRWRRMLALPRFALQVLRGVNS